MLWPSRPNFFSLPIGSSCAHRMNSQRLPYQNYIPVRVPLPSPLHSRAFSQIIPGSGLLFLPNNNRYLFLVVTQDRDLAGNCSIRFLLRLFWEIFPMLFQISVCRYNKTGHIISDQISTFIFDFLLYTKTLIYQI